MKLKEFSLKKLKEKEYDKKQLISVVLTIAILIIGSFAILKMMEEDSEDENKKSSPGDFTLRYLKGNKYERVVIEIDYELGCEPSEEAVNLLKTRISENCDKSEIVWDKTLSDVFEPKGSAYSLREIQDLEDEYRDEYFHGKTAVIYCLYLGEFEDKDVLGIAYHGSSIAIFKETIRNAETGLVSAEEIEKSVIVHEFGHLLALVNIGYVSDIDHEDKDYPHHCTHTTTYGIPPFAYEHPDCVMHWAVESTDIVNQFQRAPPNDYCEHCKHDLEMLKNS